MELVAHARLASMLYEGAGVACWLSGEVHEAGRGSQAARYVRHAGVAWLVKLETGEPGLGGVVCGGLGRASEACTRKWCVRETRQECRLVLEQDSAGSCYGDGLEVILFFVAAFSFFLQNLPIFALVLSLYMLPLLVKDASPLGD